MKKISLKKGHHALVDDEDYQYLSRFTWVIVENKVGEVNVGMSVAVGKKNVRVPMWRFIINGQIQRKLIFLNRNPLDHQKSNLRLVTPAEFNAHCGKRKNNSKRGEPTSKYKGVSLIPRSKNKKWLMTIQYKGKAFSKAFHSEKEAAVAYNEKAKQYYGDIAYLNEV